MDVIYLIPERLLFHLQRHPKLSDHFNYVDHESYNQMMVLVISEIMQDKYSSYEHFRMIHITKDLSDAWMECFIQTLHELKFDDETKKQLTRKMQRVLEEMTRSPEICDFISEMILNSSSPRRLIKHLQHRLEELSTNNLEKENT